MPEASDLNVFVNCPFDKAYARLFQALVFTIHDCGFVVRCVLEDQDTGTPRLSKLEALIKISPQGIHDLSRTELDAHSGWPRFNMPLELGLFLGAKLFGTQEQQAKRILVLDCKHYRYQIFCSDLAGQDPKAHDADEERLVDVVRTWLRASLLLPSTEQMPGEERIARRYREFEEALPELCRRAGIRASKMPFDRYADFVHFVVEWQRASPL